MRRIKHGEIVALTSGSRVRLVLSAGHVRNLDGVVLWRLFEDGLDRGCVSALRGDACPALPWMLARLGRRKIDAGTR